MSYFDHVQCHSCGARMDPEKIVPNPGEMPSCPYCKAQLNLTDLFGVKDSFVGLHDDGGNDHSLDDVLSNDLYDGRYVDGRPPPSQAPPSQPPPRRAPPQRASSSGPPDLRALKGPVGGSSSSGALVPTGSRDPWEDDDDGGDAPSAADLLRSMKRRK